MAKFSCIIPDLTGIRIEFRSHVLTLLILQCFKMFHYSFTSSRGNATEDQTKLEQQIWTKASERRVCNIYSLSFSLVGSCCTYKLD